LRISGELKQILPDCSDVPTAADNWLLAANNGYREYTTNPACLQFYANRRLAASGLGIAPVGDSLFFLYVVFR